MDTTKENKEDKEKKKVYAELIEGNSDEDEDEEEKNTIEDNIIGTPVENTVITDNTNSNGVANIKLFYYCNCN